MHVLAFVLLLFGFLPKVESRKPLVRLERGQAQVGREPVDPSDETACKLVSSRGLMLSCDVHPLYPKSDVPDLTLARAERHKHTAPPRHASLARFGMGHYPDAMHKFGDGVVVYVVTTALDAFISEVLPKYNGTFKLVTGDSDSSPKEVLGVQKFRTLVDDHRLLKWFAQNAVSGESLEPKIGRIPIGLDYHTLKASATTWGPQATPAQQELSVMRMSENARKFGSRNSKIFSCMSPDSERRNEIASALANQPDLVDIQPVGTDREKFWHGISEHRFVASPPGNGVDCHRTWETIALGSIPIVSDDLAQLYSENGFNVVTLMVFEWSYLANDSVRQKMKDAENRHKDGLPEAMQLKYWRDKIRA